MLKHFTKAIQAADYDVEKAEKVLSILMIDKIARKSENPSITRMFRGRCSTSLA